MTRFSQNTGAQEYRAWLQTLKTGDKYTAFYPSRWGNDRLVDIEITRATDKSVYTGNSRFNRSNGKCIGSSGSLAAPATTEQIDAVNLQSMRSKAFRDFEVKMKSLNISQVTRILDVLNEIE